jgi:hypothetical protein
VLGAAAGTASVPGGPAAPRKGIVAACAVLIAALVPWHMRAMANEADLEHIGIGLSAWHLSDDGWRYREGQGHATLFVPSGGFKVAVNPRVANIVVLRPHEWNTIKMPGRSEASRARYARLDLRLLDEPRAMIWITKVEPFEAASSALRSR